MTGIVHLLVVVLLKMVQKGVVSNNFNGNIDDLLIYDRALSEKKSASFVRPSVLKADFRPVDLGTY